MGRTGQPAGNPVAPPPIPALVDARVRAVAALAPVGVVFGVESLAKVRIPTAIYAAKRDRFLVSRFHAHWIARNLPGLDRQALLDQLKRELRPLLRGRVTEVLQS